MRSLVPVAFVLAALLFVGAYVAGYPVPGEASVESLQGAEVVSVPDDRPANVSDPSSTQFRRWVEFYVHLYVNEERRERGKTPLEFDAGLRTVARGHSVEMARQDYFAHVSPDGEDPGDRYRESNYFCLQGAGENIAYTYFGRRVRIENGTVDRYRSAKQLARGVVTQWMNSPGHRRNLLSPNWEREGIGVYYADDGRIFVTQNFC
ncbi:CAP domain-containing protein [Halomicrococcus sp. NG-SE-24]|uniref:CAP domain-containing protein n=1 Tax=Halomicrococcus sp. NG-SE-24 TaxID=3436928 RepID=UPI003D9906B5